MSVRFGDSPKCAILRRYICHLQNHFLQDSLSLHLLNIHMWSLLDAFRTIFSETELLFVLQQKDLLFSNPFIELIIWFASITLCFITLHELDFYVWAFEVFPTTLNHNFTFIYTLIYVPKLMLIAIGRFVELLPSFLTFFEEFFLSAISERQFFYGPLLLSKVVNQLGHF